MAHGDDFVFCGSNGVLDWVAKELTKITMLNSTGKLGGDRTA